MVRLILNGLAYHREVQIAVQKVRHAKPEAMEYTIRVLQRRSTNPIKKLSHQVADL